MKDPSKQSSEICCFIVHSVEPYLHDVMQLLALPQGLQYRLRYDHSWIHSALTQNIEHLQGAQALALFCDDTTRTLYPLRWSTIAVARQVGRIFYFELMLQELPSYESDPETRNAQVLGFNNTLAGFHRDLFVQPIGKPALDLCVFRSGAGQHVGKVEFENLANWGNVVDAVGQSAPFEKAEFIKILDLVSGSGDVVSPQNAAYSLEDGRTYTLRIFQIVPNAGDSRGDPHDIELRSYSDHIRVLRQRQRVVGKYDVLTYVLRASGLASGERTALELVPIPSDPQRNSMTGLYLPVAGKMPSLLSRIVRLIAVGISLVLIFLPIVLTAGTWGQALSFIGVVAFVLSILGWRPVLEVLGLFRVKV